MVLGNGWYNQRAHTVEGLLWYGTAAADLSDRSRRHGQSAATRIGNGRPVRLFTIRSSRARFTTHGWRSRAGTTSGFDDASWKPAVRVCSRRTGGCRRRCRRRIGSWTTLEPIEDHAAQRRSRRICGRFRRSSSPVGCGCGCAARRALEVVVELCERLNNGVPVFTPDQQPTSSTYILKGQGRRGVRAAVHVVRRSLCEDHRLSGQVDARRRLKAESVFTDVPIAVQFSSARTSCSTRFSDGVSSGRNCATCTAACRAIARTASDWATRATGRSRRKRR